MAAMVYNKLWDPATDSVTIRGNFQADAGDPNEDWAGFYYKMSLLQDTVYGVTVTFPSSKIGNSYTYKYVAGPNSWEVANIRSFTCPTKDSILSTYWFSDDSSHIPNNRVINTVTFTADISSILGTGDGYFNPAKDSLVVLGLDWNGGYVSVTGNRLMTESKYVVGKFSTTLQITGKLGTSCEWKFRIYPYESLINTGYETGANRQYVIQADSSIVNLPMVVPNFGGEPYILFSPVTTLFECDMNHNPVNAKNGRAIPVDSILFIGIKGGYSELGSWGGNWTEADTVQPNPTMVVLHDDGFFGDETAGDKIYSRSITFPAGSSAGIVEFNYSVSYPAAETDAGGITPLNNEGVPDIHHYFTLTEGKPTKVSVNFGTYYSTGINENESITNRFYLLQNYPNPFNPSTKIEYTVPGTGFVSLKIFDLLGREVATLVNKEMNAGSYSAKFNAAHLPSGIYFYKLTAGNNSIIKKMLLLK
jgi:hypothetical protein